MKRITCILLLISFLICFSGCEKESQLIPNNTNIEETVSTTETETPVVENTTESETPVVEDTTDSTFSIHFIDVGQADSALVECDGRYMLIDGGNRNDSDVVYSVLKNNKVPKLDIVVATHAHEDHIGGLPGAYNYTDADITLSPVLSYDSDVFEDFKSYAGKIEVPNVGDEYILGSAVIKILGVNSTDETNNTSIVLKIEYGDTSFLFTGDAEREAEEVILDSGIDLKADLLKVGHHGSENSTTYPFLRQIMPELAIVSVGEDNSYGHPTEEALSRLKDADVKVYRTDLQGDIFCTSDGKSITLSCSKNENADTYQGYQPTIIEKPIDEPVTETLYIINVNTEKFHYASCSSVKRMNESNKKSYNGTREELISKGYEPCKNCNP